MLLITVVTCVREYDMHFLSFRFWIGTWVMVILLLIAAFDLSFIVRYITRFTEESFAVLISIIFIYEAFTKTLEVILFLLLRIRARFECSSNNAIAPRTFYLFIYLQ